MRWMRVRRIHVETIILLLASLLALFLMAHECVNRFVQE